MSGTNAVYQKICCATLPCESAGSDRVEVGHPEARTARTPHSSHWMAYTEAGALVAAARDREAPSGLQEPSAPLSIGWPFGSPFEVEPAIDSQASVIRQPRSGARLP